MLESAEKTSVLTSLGSNHDVKIMHYNHVTMVTVMILLKQTWSIEYHISECALSSQQIAFYNQNTQITAALCLKKNAIE